MEFTKHWIDNYAVEGATKYTCPTCGVSSGLVAGDMYRGTTYENGESDWRGWGVLKCGHAVSRDWYADEDTERLTPNDFIIITR
jgi:hypothetical protein